MSVYLPPDPCRMIPMQGSYEGLPICFRDSSVSPQFINTIFNTLVTIPPQLLHVIATQGFFLILSGLMSEVHPEDRFQKPRGHCQSSKPDDLNGRCCPDQRHIHITEYTRKGRERDTAETLRHELGHAFDASVGRHIGFGNRDVSLTYDFNQIYLIDVGQINAYDQKNLNYYIQKSTPAGRSEAFAEATASLIGGGCSSPSYFHYHFPRTVHWIEENIFDHLGILRTQTLQQSPL